MKVRFLLGLEAVRTSYWFLPACFVFGVMALAPWTMHLDGKIAMERLPEYLSWIYGAGVESSRELLSTIAGSLITVLGVLLSMTMVVLTLESSQYGPRVLQNFMKDRVEQFVLAIFTSTFIYCLLILREIGGREKSFIPYFSILVILALTLVSVASLIYFIHHIARVVQASQVISQLGSEMNKSIDTLYPERIGSERKEPVPAGAWRQYEREPDPERDFILLSSSMGYVEGVDTDRIFRLAVKYDWVIRLRRRPGDFLAGEDPLLVLYGTRTLKESLQKDLQTCFILGKQRTVHQDIRYGAQLLTEVALRSLSPAVNQPYVGMMCLDYLIAALKRLAGRALPSPYRLDRQGKLRVLAYPANFCEVLEASYSPIRENAVTMREVSARMLNGIALISEAVERPEDKEALCRQVERLRSGISIQAWTPQDREEIEALLTHVDQILGQPRQQTLYPGTRRISA